MIRKLPILLMLGVGAVLATATGCGDTILPTNPGPGPGPGPGTPPELPPADPATVVIEDDVDAENGGQSQPNYTNFRFWDVVVPCVDLHGPGGVNPRPGNGLYIDLDGTCASAGTIESKQTFELHPAAWRLEIIAAGNSQEEASGPDSVKITVGAENEWMLVLDWDDDFAQFDYNFTLADSLATKVRLEHFGNDQQGILIDAVRLRFLK